MSAALESSGLCIVIFKTLTSGSTVAAVSAMQIGFVFPFLYREKNGDKTGFLIFSILLACTGVVFVILIYVMETGSDAWWLIGVVMVFLSMIPYFNMKQSSNMVQNGQENRNDSTENDSTDSSTQSGRNDNNVADNSSEKMDIWKVVLISAIFKIIFIFVASILLIQFAMEKMNFEDAWNADWNWNIDDGIYIYFLSHLIASFVAYVIAVFACHTCMDRGAFMMPLLLSSPLSYLLFMVKESCVWIHSFKDPSWEFCFGSPYLQFNMVALVCMSMSICLVYGRLLWNVKQQVLLKETKVKKNHRLKSFGI